MKIYTKTGDKGTTALVGGRRVSKGDLKIEAYGTVDELNSWIGLVRDQAINESRRDLLKEIQDRLFTIGADLASEPEQVRKKPVPSLIDDDITLLENEMDKMDTELMPLRAFVLPGGNQSVSFAHLARTVCRRAERLAIRLSAEEEVNPMIVKYLNRLSDYLFVLSRKMTQELGSEEITWKPRM
ncbi:cob(I)yrinic acid a,c-diamide adenosyltransferase [Emticicia soli]|uniref:Corrinoid adenosyltransferase n=1 Tax=Emticicia soli TaxID=2027878 RepID=A0ABW5J7S8_9BACT